MQWEIWLVPLIAMAVWILGSLLRGSVEERQRNNNGPQRPNPAGPPPQGGRPQRPASDLEKFLQEVHRRRLAGEKREGDSTKEAPRSIPDVERSEPHPQPRTVPAATRQSPAPKRTQRPAPRPRSRQPGQDPAVLDVVVVEEVKTPVAQPVAASPLPPSVVPLAAEVLVPTALLRTLPPTTTRSSAPRVAPSLAALLSSPRALRNAVILKEIFGQPLCKRKK